MKRASRMKEMVAIACDILRDEGSEAIRHYDEADCDGFCVADDLEDAMEDLLSNAENNDLLVALKRMVADCPFGDEPSYAMDAIAKAEGRDT